MPDFVNGLRAQKPNDNAPDFVKGKLSIKREDLMAWLSERQEEWINVQIKESGRTGNWYAEVDTWEPQKP